MTIEPDTKDWTWVLHRRCDECGFDATAIAVDELPELIRANAAGWHAALQGPDVAVRRVPTVWSTLEYGCHVRDVHVLFDQRIASMLAQDGPRFAHWDQDVAAVELQYGEQDPTIVDTELGEGAAAVAARYASVTSDQWQRSGTRSDGFVFTVESLGRYHLHDVVHHLYDVRS